MFLVKDLDHYILEDKALSDLHSSCKHWRHIFSFLVLYVTNQAILKKNKDFLRFSALSLPAFVLPLAKITVFTLEAERWRISSFSEAKVLLGGTWAAVLFEM